MMTMQYRSCPICYSDFIPKKANQIYCSYCRVFRRDEIRHYIEQHRPKIREHGHKFKTIEEIMLEKDIYNRKYDTNYTYGQYVMKLENGWLKE